MYKEKQVSCKIIEKDGYDIYKRDVYNPNTILKAQQTLKDLRRELPNALKDGKKNERSLYRTKKRILEILRYNLNDNSRFVTLTYKAQNKDYNKSYKQLEYVRNKIKNKTGVSLKYIAVKELQNENRDGVIHYHVITFNHSDLDWAKYWTYGFVYVKDIKDFNHERIANYFVSYFTKDKKNQMIAKQKNMFSYSRDLKKPKEYKINENQYHMVVDSAKNKIDISSNYLSNNKVLVKSMNIEDLGIMLFGKDKIKVYD